MAVDEMLGTEGDSNRLHVPQLGFALPAQPWPAEP
jgi:hypothetical protein